MVRRSFVVIDIVEVLEHWYAGRPKVVVADSLGVDRKTMRRDLREDWQSLRRARCCSANPVRHKHDRDLSPWNFGLL
jgi:hypothetical protein